MLARRLEVFTTKVVEQRRLGRVAESSRNEKKHEDEKDYTLRQLEFVFLRVHYGMKTRAATAQP